MEDERFYTIFAISGCNMKVDLFLDLWTELYNLLEGGNVLEKFKKTKVQLKIPKIVHTCIVENESSIIDQKEVKTSHYTYFEISENGVNVSPKENTEYKKSKAGCKYNRNVTGKIFHFGIVIDVQTNTIHYVFKTI